MSEPLAPPRKTVVEIYSDTHARLSEAAASTGNSMKRMTSLLLDYALGKLDAGEIVLREPTVEEAPNAEVTP
jgi:hypothetical protein